MEDQDLLNSSMSSSHLSHSQSLSHPHPHPHPHPHSSSQHQHHQQHHHQHHQQQQHQQHQQHQHPNQHQHQHHQHHQQQYIFDDNININNISSLSNLSNNNLDLSLNTSLSTFAPSLSLTTSASAPVLPSSTLPSSLSLSLPLAVLEHGRYDYDYYQSQSHSLTPTPATTTTTRRASTQLQSNRNKRTKLSTEERAKVLEIRRQRACLRCKMLKIQCSRDNPCKPCLSSAVRGYERKVLSFCYCVRTRFADVDIFSSGHTPNINTSSSPKTFTFGARTEVPVSIRRLMDQIEPPTLPVMEENVFEDTLLRWLTSASEEFSPMSGSIVAMLYTIIGQSESLKKAVDAHLPSDFQTFIFTTSLVHTGWKGSVSHRDLCIAGHVCGSRIVQRLDRILTPQFLAKCDKDTHRALLLLIFGLILGVSYSTRLTTSPSFPQDLLGLEMRHSPTLWLALKEHLAQMLAHHLIFLGSTLGIKLDTASEKTIIETAVNRWNKPERSLWAGKDSMERSAAVERSNEIALISRVFGLHGMEDFSTLQDLSGPPTSQTPRTVTAGDGTPSQTHPSKSSMPSAHPSTTAPMTSTGASSLPIVAVTYPDLTDLQSMPPMTSNDDDEFYHSHEHSHQSHQREGHPLDDTLDNNPESFYAMADDDITALLSPVANLERENVDNANNENENDNAEGSKDGQSEREDGDSQAGDSDNSNANTNRAVTKTSTAATTTMNAPPPPSRNAMGNDGMVNNTRKRRSVWIVRPYSDNEAQEPVNVYARFRVHQGQNLGLFV